MVDLVEILVNFFDKFSEAFFGRDEYCNLLSMAKFEMHDVKIVADYRNLKEGTDPNYLIICYNGIPVATANPNSLAGRPVHFPLEYDQKSVEQLWKVLETYYS